MASSLFRLTPRIRRAAAAWLTIFFALLLAGPAIAGSALAKTPAPDASASPVAAQTVARDPAKLYIDADKLVYDKTRDLVNADGAVVLYYKNRVLQADHVVYDRAQKRVAASGRVKLTDERGNVTYARRLDLTDDFATGFADAVQTITTDKTRLSSPRIERTNDTVTTLQNGVYTACEPCKAHPEWPPLWQIRAGEIIENQETHTVYFRDAYFDALGVPIAYLPYFSTPDPTVTRQSGFLTPTYVSKNTLGLGVTTPYFFALAPNYDLTLAPSVYSQQGVLLDAQWRHRLENGAYGVKLSGIDQLDPRAFYNAPYGAGNLKFRGSAESDGKFYLNENWTVGWDLTLLSDRFFLTDYGLRALDPTQYYFQDVVSQVYLRGQAGRGFFDLTGYAFQPTIAFLDRDQDPNPVPTFDYHRTFALDADHFGGIGGEATVELNAANINRQEALYQSIGAERLDPAYSLYQVCGAGRSGTDYTRANCLLRGIAGNYARATEQVSWSRQYVDPVGEVWKPFAFERLTGDQTNLASGASTYTSAAGTALIPNYAQPAFFGGDTSAANAIGMAGVGLEWRYPFVSNTFFGQQVVEPIAQIIARPNEFLPKLQPNEDAQSLVFDDTTLFNWSKFSGFDRVEGGTRANYGAQYTASFANGGHANVVAGESVQIAGQNSYTLADAANTGLDSGLDKTWSNYVAGETVQPTAAPFSLGLKQQFDHDTLNLTRFDAILIGKLGGFDGSVDFANYAAQPLIGYPYPREGLITRSAYKFSNGVVLSGGVTLDMSRRYYDPSYKSPFYASQYNVGLAYSANDCATVRVGYNSALTVPLSTTPGVPPAPAVRDQTFLFELDLRTLGDVRGSSGVP